MSKMNIPFSPPDISQLEIDEVVDTLQSGWITTGPKTKELERQLSDFTRTNKTVCLNSATAGLELILRVLGVGPGDEVIVPAMTYTASCSVITHVGATPVIVDIQKDGFEMDYTQLKMQLILRQKLSFQLNLPVSPVTMRNCMRLLIARPVCLKQQLNGKKPLIESLSYPTVRTL